MVNDWYQEKTLIESTESSDTSEVCERALPVMSFRPTPNYHKFSVKLFRRYFTCSAPNLQFDVLPNSPKLSLTFLCKQVGRILFFIFKR